MTSLLRVAWFFGGRLALLPILLLSLSGLAMVRFFGPRIEAGMLAELRTAQGKEVMSLKRNMLLLALCCAGCAADPAGGSTSLLPPGQRGPVPVPLDDAGAVLVDAFAPAADVLVSADVLAVADALPPLAPDAAEAYPTCTSIGYAENGGGSCDDRRTRGQGYSCMVCGLGQGPPPQPCESSYPHPGDLPWLCVRRCADCAAIVRCTGVNMCTLVRQDDGGVL